MTAQRNYYLRPTSQFCIVGLIIPGFTVFAIMGAQMGIAKLGVECSETWSILWTITSLGMVIAPIIFIALLTRRFRQGFYLSTKALLIFNILEYTFLQSTFASFLTNGRTLCYVSDGQNGIEFVFTGWMALPILAVSSFLFDKVIERKIDESIKGDEFANQARNSPNPDLIAKRKKALMLLAAYLVIVGALTLYYGYHWWDVVHYKGDETIYYAFFLLTTSTLFQLLVWMTTKQKDWRFAIFGTLVNFVASLFVGFIFLAVSGLSGIPRELIFIYGTFYLTFFTISIVWQVNRLRE